MEQLVIVGAVTVLLVFVHAAFAVYLYRSLSAERERGENAASATERFGPTIDATAGETTPESADSDGSNERSTVSCPTCGTPNDPSFQFCRHCVSDLSSHTLQGDDAASQSSS